jgi:hypothetical protein
MLFADLSLRLGVRILSYGYVLMYMAYLMLVT